ATIPPFMRLALPSVNQVQNSPIRILPGAASTGLSWNRIVTQDSWTYTVINGRLAVVDPQTRKPILTEIEAIVRINLGADGHVYALTKKVFLIKIPPQETANLALKSHCLIQLPLAPNNEIQDFAISPAGSVVYTLKSGYLGHFAYIPASRFQEV